MNYDKQYQVTGYMHTHPYDIIVSAQDKIGAISGHFQNIPHYIIYQGEPYYFGGHFVGP
jgi:hypothetical protein